MIDLRTHLFSLIAVFIALGLGMVIGVDLIGGKGIVSQEKALVRRLEADFAQLRSQNATLSQTIHQQTALISVEDGYGSQTVPLIVSGKLVGMNVAVVTTQEGLDPTPYLNLLKEAGATPGPVVSLVPLSTQATAAAAQELGVADTADAVYGDLAKTVAQAMSTGNTTYLKALEGLGLFHVTGTFSPSTASVLLIAGSATAPDPLARPFGVPLVQDLLADHLTVTEGEPSTVPSKYSTIPTFDRLGIGTVDDLDLAPGQVAVVWGLSGSTGTWGEKPTAQALMPPLAATAP